MACAANGFAVIELARGLGTVAAETSKAVTRVTNTNAEASIER